MTTSDRDENTAKRSPQRTRAKSTGTQSTGTQSTGTQGQGRSQQRTRQQSADRKPRPTAIARAGSEQLAELTHRQPEAVTALSRTDDGWRLELEVLEIHKIPETADVMAVYQADLDEDGDLVSYRRLRRYVRGQAREE